MTETFVSKCNQATLTVTGPTSVTYGSTGGLTSSGGSGGGALTYSAGTSTGCNITGGTTLNVNNASGTCSITANRATDTNYLATTSASFTVTLNKANQTVGGITFTPTTLTAGTTTTASATATSGLAVTFTSLTGTVCTASGTNGATITGVAVGTCTIAADQAVSNNYNAAPQVTNSISVTIGSQTITFGPQGAQTFVAAGTFPLSPVATTTSGLTISYSSSTPGVCTIAGTTVTMVTAGTCTITASQAGNTSYNAATPVPQSITINKANQTITFGTQGAQTYSSGGTFALSPVASATSGLAIAYTSTTPSVCTIPIAGTTVTILTAGTCTITASQGGDTNYNAASPQVTRSITINKANQTITFGPQGPQTFVAAGTFALSPVATTTSGLTISYSSSTTGVCTIATPTVATVTVVTAGTCTIAANQTGDTNWNIAPQVTQSITINKANQAPLTVTAPTSLTYGSTATLSPSGGSGGGGVTYSAGTSTGCSVAGTTLSVTNASGTCSVTATKAADTNYNATTSAAATVTLNKANQTIGAITFAPTTLTAGTTITASATATSGLAVTFTSLTGTCTATGTNGATITGVAVGPCTIAADQAGNNNYNAASPQVTKNITITIGNQAITVTTPAPANAAYNSSFTVAATASSGLPVTYSSGSPTICTNSGATFTMILPTGTCVVWYDQAGDTNYNAATRVTSSTTTATKASQTITVTTPAPATAALNSSFTVAATASSGLTVAYSSGSTSVCTAVGATFTMIVTTGTCIVRYDQGGNTYYNAATRVSSNTTATKINQTIGAITFTPTTLEVGGSTTASATATSGLAVTFTSTTPAICTATGTNGATINGVSAGTCTIAANQGGSTNYNAASPTVTQTITVNTPNCTSNATGNWNASTTWILCRNGVPLAGDAVTILSGHTVTLNYNTPVSLGNLTNSGTLNASGTYTLSVGGSLTNNGTISLGSSNVDLHGDFENTTGSSFNPSNDSGTWSFSGAAVQNIDSPYIFTFPNLLLNNTSGIALNASARVNTRLTLTNGYISTGTNILILLANCLYVSSTNGTSWQRTNGFVAGNVRLTFPTGTTTCTFPVGSGSTYAPIGIYMVASAGGTLTGSTTGEEHPQIGTSGIDANGHDVNRYWSLGASGDTVVASSYGATFNFISGDLDATATTSNFVIGKYDSGAWTNPTPITTGITAGPTSTGISNVPGPITFPSTTDFAAGEKTFVCSVPSDLPSNMVCYCDNFNRVSVNPSSLFGDGSGFSLTSTGTGTATGWPLIANGHLQMTNNTTNMSTSATVPGTFPAAGNLVSVEFLHYAYQNGGGVIGADGIGVTLSDSAVTPLAGAYGGSLGYAQKTGINGFSGGWIGVGIDEYGNFQSSIEGRSGGACGTAACRPESIGVRGSGTGVTGYPFLGGTATLSPVIDNTSSATPARGHAYRVQVDARCYQNNTFVDGGVNFPVNCATANPTPANSTPAKWARVRVYRDTTGAGNFVGLSPLPNLDFEAYAVALAAIPSAIQADVPVTWKLSFTGSTGDSLNFHEIGNLKICAQTITPPAGYRIQVDNLTPSTCGTAGGSPASPIVTVTALDTNGNPVTTYNKTVTLSAPLSAGGASSALWSLKTGGGVFSGGNQYAFVSGDHGVAQFYLTDASPQSVTVGVSENGGTISSSLAPPPIVYAGGSFTIANIDLLAANSGGGVVAGRPHKMSVTRSNGCTTDTTYRGAKNLDGWYTAVTGDHPTNAAAPDLCATNSLGTCLPTPGACQTLSFSPPTVNPASNNMPALTFGTLAPGNPPNGVAYFCLATSDVGKYSISLRDDSATPVLGSSGTLTVRPFAVVVSGLTGNPAVTTATGTAFTSAGSTFPATVGGYLWNTSADTGANGLPGSTVDSTTMNLIAARLAHYYSDTVTLTADTTAANFAPPAVLPAVQGALTGGSVTVTGGVTGGSGSSSTLSYSEVGSFTLKATPASSYLNTALVDLGPRVVIFSNPSSTAQNKWVGRFIPHHFGITGSVVTRSDVQTTEGQATPFTYMDEPMKLLLTITAQNASGGTTQNYSDATLYSKLDTTALAQGTGANWFNTGCTGSTKCMGLGAVNGATGLTDRLAIVPSGTYGLVVDPAISWALGVGTVSAHVKLARSASPDGPFETLRFGAMPRDSDGVTAASPDLDAATGDTATFGNPNGTPERRLIATTKARFGRLWLGNACGSENRDMTIPFRTEYWNGNVFVTNTDDSTTSIANANIGLGNQQPAGFNVSVDRTHIPAGPISVVSGLGGSFPLVKPTGTPASGSVDIVFDLGSTTTTNTSFTFTAPQGPTAGASLAYLRGKWYGLTYDRDPVARAAFGIYCGGSGSRQPIYIRESY